MADDISVPETITTMIGKPRAIIMFVFPLILQVVMLLTSRVRDVTATEALLVRSMFMIDEGVVHVEISFVGW